MTLNTLEVRGLRNLTSLSLTLSPALNLLFGDNGSGKTSVLEAVHLLGLARSFRTQQARKLVQNGCSATTVFGRVEVGGIEHALGVEKQLDGTGTIRIDGERQSSTARLAELLPLQLITPESHSLLSGEPRERRAYLDWGLFHVEHGFLEVWKRYRRHLEQRNAGLRSGTADNEMALWEQGLAASGEMVTSMRESHVAAITPVFERIYRGLVDDQPPRLVLRRGWPQEFSLQETLAKNRASERSAGYTMAGIHRADMRLVLPNGRDAADTLSRGQQKLAVCALRIAQMEYLQQARGLRCTLLLDDLPAELDTAKRAALMDSIARSQAQCLLTATDRGLLDLTPWPDMAVFHVEHGEATKVI